MTKEERLEKDRIRGKIWYAKNKEKRQKSIRAWAKRNRERKLAIDKKWRDDNPEKYAESQRKYRANNPDRIKERREARKEKSALWHKEWFQKTKEERREQRKAIYQRWAKNNPHKICAYAAERRASLILRTPKWLTDEDFDAMDSVYQLAVEMSEAFGCKYHVDHIIPLNGKTVSGLHVPDNLQILPGKENIAKKNKYNTKIMEVLFMNGVFTFSTNGVLQIA